jgi:ubiquinone/menaquinone biosynthesis C-methylase UbiE
MTVRREPTKDDVRAFWEQEACGERYGDHQERLRYELEPEILAFADFGSSAGRRVLEIGVGMGADLVRFARAGADVSGVDLTERAVSIARERLARAGLTGDVRLADAESLPFHDASFDIVWSWGVLHHTPDTAEAIAEACRVLRPGGRLRVMLYHRRSWFALAAWARFGFLRGRPSLSLREAVAHVESPGTQAFTVGEVEAMLVSMDDVSVRPCLTKWDRRVAPLVSALSGHRYGWFLLADARKPAPTS